MNPRPIKVPITTPTAALSLPNEAAPEYISCHTVAI